MILVEVAVNLLSQNITLLVHLAVVQSKSLDLEHQALLLVPDFLPRLYEHVLPSMHVQHLKMLLGEDGRIALDSADQPFLLFLVDLYRGQRISALTRIERRHLSGKFLDHRLSGGLRLVLV